MHTNDDKLLFKEEVFQIVGCTIEVLNTLGHGLVEKPYENALPSSLVYKGYIFSSNLRSISFTRVRRSACSFPI
jgi:hypothetical protein